MKKMLLLAASLVMLSEAQAADFACMEDCFRQGYGRGHCMAVCDNRPAPGPGMLDQPGLPKNPAFDQLQRDSAPQQRALPQVADPKCIADCRKMGYNYSLCRRNCSY